MKYIFALIMMMSISAGADVSFSFKSSGGFSKEACSPKMQVSKYGIRMEFANCTNGQGMGHGFFLFDAVEKKSYIVDEQRKVAALQPDLAEMRANMEKQAKVLNEMMAKMPPQARAKLAKLNPHAMGDAGRPVIKDLGKRQIGKWNCTMVAMSTGYSEVEHCLVELADAGFTKEDLDQLKNFAIQQKNAQGGQALFYDELMSRYENKITVWSHTLKPRDSVSELIDVKHDTLPKSVFALDGYKMVPMTDYMKMQSNLPGK